MLERHELRRVVRSDSRARTTASSIRGGYEPWYIPLSSPFPIAMDAQCRCKRARSSCCYGPVSGKYKRCSRNSLGSYFTLFPVGMNSLLEISLEVLHARELSRRTLQINPAAGCLPGYEWVSIVDWVGHGSSDIEKSGIDVECRRR